MKGRTASLAAALLTILLGCLVVVGLVTLLDLPSWINVVASAVWGALTGPKVYHWFSKLPHSKL